MREMADIRVIKCALLFIICGSFCLNPSFNHATEDMVKKKRRLSSPSILQQNEFVRVPSAIPMDQSTYVIHQGALAILTPYGIFPLIEASTRLNVLQLESMENKS